MLAVDRFVVQSRWHEDWLEARELGVTATMVAEAATPSGFASLVDSWSHPFTGNGFTEFGSWAERYVMESARAEGILPNDWLIRGERETDLGTPDGLSLDHTLIGEAKTGGTMPKLPPRKHRDQCQWNLWVTGAERCLYLFQQRAVADDGSFYLVGLEPAVWWIDRDDARIAELVVVADRVMEEKARWRSF